MSGLPTHSRLAGKLNAPCPCTGQQYLCSMQQADRDTAHHSGSCWIYRAPAADTACTCNTCVAALAGGRPPASFGNAKKAAPTGGTLLAASASGRLLHTSVGRTAALPVRAEDAQLELRAPSARDGRRLRLLIETASAAGTMIGPPSNEMHVV